MSERECCGNFVGGHDPKHCALLKAEAEIARLKKEFACMQSLYAKMSVETSERVIGLRIQVEAARITEAEEAGEGK